MKGKKYDMTLASSSLDILQLFIQFLFERITEGLDFARSKYDALASLSDGKLSRAFLRTSSVLHCIAKTHSLLAVALLDLCHSFADKVTLSRLPWSRPLVSDDYRETSDSGSISISGGIMIRNGRYCIDVTDSYLAAADGPQDVVPNDTYATGEKSFTVISGINGSGKSTYLKQIGIIVLLAHCGSYVPAEQASIPVSSYCFLFVGFVLLF